MTKLQKVESNTVTNLNVDIKRESVIRPQNENNKIKLNPISSIKLISLDSIQEEEQKNTQNINQNDLKHNLMKKITTTKFI